MGDGMSRVLVLLIVIAVLGASSGRNPALFGVVFWVALVVLLWRRSELRRRGES